MVETPDMFFGHVREICDRKKSANMIFGFNTDIRVQGTVYHVQTEVREQERRLESQVFVSGRCIGKRSAPADSRRGRRTRKRSRSWRGRSTAGWWRRFAKALWTTCWPRKRREEMVVQFLGSQRISGMRTWFFVFEFSLADTLRHRRR